MKLIQLKHGDLKSLRKKQWEKQNKKCPILNKKIDLNQCVLDHKHLTKKEIEDGKIGEDGKGLLRGVLNNQINVFLGKIENAWKRTGCHKFGVNLSDVLIRCGYFLENPPMEQKYIHPKEAIKPKKLMKRDYNKVKKYYSEMYPRRKKPLPKFDKKMKLTKKWIELINKANEYHKKEK